EESVARLQEALRQDDSQAAQEAADDLRAHAASAHDRTEGPLWSGLAILPLLGDDVGGIRSLTSSLDVLAADGVDPLIQASGLAKRLPTDGGLDLEVIDELAEPLAEARDAFGRAAQNV